jgi:hypothetical protein
MLKIFLAAKGEKWNSVEQKPHFYGLVPNSPNSSPKQCTHTSEATQDEGTHIRMGIKTVDAHKIGYEKNLGRLQCETCWGEAWLRGAGVMVEW